MAKKFRSDARIGTVEKKLGIGNCIANPNGRNARSDKKLGTLIEDWKKSLKRS